MSRYLVTLVVLAAASSGCAPRITLPALSFPSFESFHLELGQEFQSAMAAAATAQGLLRLRDPADLSSLAFACVISDHMTCPPEIAGQPKYWRIIAIDVDQTGDELIVPSDQDASELDALAGACQAAQASATTQPANYPYVGTFYLKSTTAARPVVLAVEIAVRLAQVEDNAMHASTLVTSVHALSEVEQSALNRRIALVGGSHQPPRTAQSSPSD